MTAQEKISVGNAWLDKFDTEWKRRQEILESMSTVKSCAEYAMLYDLNGYNDNDDVPEPLKRLRENIEKMMKENG